MEKDTQPELRLEWWEPDKLTPNPLNWRRHPTHQQQSFAGVFGQVRWAGAALYNEQTSHLIDGHLRRDWAIEASERVPVLVGSWTLEQEKLILATLDPLAGLAEPDDAKLAELLRGVQADDAAVIDLLNDLAIQAEMNVFVGGGGDDGRGSGLDSNKIIRAIIYTNDVALFEQALAKTGCSSRAEGLSAICRAYVGNDATG